MSLGLYIGRLNPPHLGHLSIIDKALAENDKVLLLIGTKQTRDNKNPLTFDEIKEILNIKYANNSKLKIMKLPDVPSDRIWTREVAKLLNGILKEHSDGIKKVNFYGGDFKNDSAYLIISKFQDGLKDYEINYIEVPRQNSFVSYDGQKYELSGTNLRQALREKNYDLAKKFCDLEMFDSILEKFKD